MPETEPGQAATSSAETPGEAYERGWQDAIGHLTHPDDVERADLAEKVAGLNRTLSNVLHDIAGDFMAVATQQAKLADAFDTHLKTSAELDAARAAIQRVRDLCGRANTMTGEPFDDVEDPTPIPGWTTLVLRALDGGDDRA